jgi:hypothetical protein
MTERYGIEALAEKYDHLAEAMKGATVAANHSGEIIADLKAKNALLLEVAEDLESWNAQSTASTAAEILAELGPILVKARSAIATATT